MGNLLCCVESIREKIGILMEEEITYNSIYLKSRMGAQVIGPHLKTSLKLKVSPFPSHLRVTKIKEMFGNFFFLLVFDLFQELLVIRLSC